MDRQLQARLENDPLLRTAAEWFVELSSDSVAGERVAEWQDWMGVEANRRTFERVEAFWNLEPPTGAVRWPTDAMVAADGYTGDETISAWKARQAALPPPNRIRRFASWAVAASVCIATTSFWMQDRGVALETVVGETRTLTLSDGSKVTAGGRTELTAKVSTQLREITLEHGEAFFEVAADKQRPFTVRTGATSVTAIGTAFNIRRTGSHTVIAVAEGSVRVDGRSAAVLKAGERLMIGATEAPESRVEVDVNSVAGWREGRLQYFNEPLSAVVADLSRYSTRDIRVDDPAIAQMQVTGVVMEQSIDGWLSSLEATFGIAAITNQDGSVRLTKLAP